MDVRGSIRLSPRYGLSTPYRLTIRKSARLFHHVLFNMGDLHLFHLELNLSTLNAGILIMLQQVRLMMFSLNMVEAVHLSFFAGQVGGIFPTLWFFMWDPSFILKSYGGGGGGWGGGLWDFSVSPRPLGFGFSGFGAKGLGPSSLRLGSLHVYLRELSGHNSKKNDPIRAY